MDVERKHLSIVKAAEHVGVSRRTIYNWIALGKVEYRRTAAGSVRIYVDTLWASPERPLQQSEGKAPQVEAGHAHTAMANTR